MPKGSPFTALCRQLAELSRPAFADLHAHTTASDGDPTPSQLVAAARLARLAAVAVTDHDTTAGVGPARAAAGGRIEVVAGVEVSAEFAGREVHVLGLFVDPGHPGLTAALAAVCDSRRERFRDYVSSIPELRPAVGLGLAAAVERGTASLGRRHVAGLLVRAGVAANHREAFGRFLHPATSQVRPKTLIPAGDAARLIHAAGGVSVLAHPPEWLTEADFDTLRELGLDGLECRFPAADAARSRGLEAAAERLGLAVSAGSDSHDPTPGGRPLGSVGASRAEFDRLRDRAGRAAGSPDSGSGGAVRPAG